MKRSIELLAPARTADIGIEAVRHGADAVYIGAPAFGARTAAGNSVADIARLCSYAHIFGARVYVAFNTILYDEELEAAASLAGKLYEAGADALIVQDFALLAMELPPIALHASTQMDTTTAAEAEFLDKAGFSQIVVARELPITRIREIACRTTVPLEAFVHGALCVSYSGRCYASEACFRRSANRGNCAQFCRLAFDLIDERNRNIIADSHLLSLRDMNRSASVEEMLDAGISSLKIEGRLKDAAYVKNVTAHYSRLLDDIVRRRPGDYCRASHGTVSLNFTPNPAKSFNRGFTEYYLHGRTADVHAFESPKSRGESLGRVAAVGRRSFRLGGTEPVQAGDGLCFINSAGKLEGLRVNRVEGAEIFPLRMPSLAAGTEIFRNRDYQFEHILSKPTAERRLALCLKLEETESGFALHAWDESGVEVTLHFDATKEEAKQSQRENITRQLSRLGTTPFFAQQIQVQTDGERFLPSSLLADWRRQIVDALLQEHFRRYQRPVRRQATPDAKYPERLPELAGNVANRLSASYLSEHGAQGVKPAFELSPQESTALMTCRHCIRYALNACPTHSHPLRPLPDRLFLRLPDGRRFPLKFDCKRCEMQVLSPTP
ncbi:MAG: U32 family peptidase [Alloprevotella sp.]|nr:U32 family peptidase [Alloprevotella sp.]